MVNYTDDNLLSLKKRKKIYTAVMIAAAAVCILICAVLCFFASYDNKVVIIAVNSAVSVLCGWLIIGCFFGFYYPCKVRIAHVKEILSAQKYTFVCTVTDFGNEITVSRELTATQIKVSDGAEHVFYWDNTLGECPLKTGGKVELTICRNFIFSYEVMTDEV